MAQGLNSTKTPGRPSHEAIEQNASATEARRSKEKRLDDVGMQSAKRAANRIHSNEEDTPGNTMFTKQAVTSEKARWVAGLFVGCD